LRSWAGSYRRAYNLTVDLLERAYLEKGKSGSYMRDRKVWTAAIREQMPWFKEIPAHTIYGAMRDAEIDYKNTVAKRAKGEACNLPRCRAKFQRSFFVLGNAITPRGIYPTKLGPIRSREAMPEKPKDSRIVFEAGKWWVRIPEEVQTSIAENQGRVCAIDPGVRTFATIFAPELIAKVQFGGFARIVRLAYCLDDLISRRAKTKNGARRRRMQVAIQRARLRIRHLVQDLHYQTIGWLFRRFGTVIVPNSDFTSAVCRATRKIRNKTVRSLLNFAFARFRDRLKHKAELYGKSVVTVCESYTSKTNNITGEISANLGGRKYIWHQGKKIDRDINGALGIFLKALLDRPSAEPPVQRQSALVSAC
jgi:putative transposase